MSKLPVKKIISKSISRMIYDFDNFVRISLFPFIIVGPLFVFTSYYDEFVLDIYNQKGFMDSMWGSKLTTFAELLIALPLTSAMLANWHRYILFDGKRPWKYFHIDFSNYVFQFILALIKISLVGFIFGFIVGFIFGLLGVSAFTMFTFIIIVMLIFSTRISMIFPASAAQHDNSFSTIFELTKEHFWSLLLIYLTFIPIAFIMFIIIFVEELLIGSNSIPKVLLQNFLTIFMIFIIYGYFASCFSECYKILKKGFKAE